MTTRSAEECEMSRSCQSATFSSPTTACRADDAREAADPLGDDRVALVRHRRRALLPASERLLHLAPPRCGRDGGSRARTSRATTAATASAASSSGVPVALEDLRRRRLPARARAARTRPLQLGIGGGVRADRARELADAHALERAREPRRVSRSSSNAQPASLRPNVVGSACTPCVRPICSVARCSSARATTAANARSSPSSTSAPASRIWSESAVSTTSEEVSP